MTLDMLTFLTLILCGIATYATRAVGPVLARRITLTPRLRGALEAVPGAVLASLIAPTVLLQGPAMMIGSVATVVAALRLPMIVAIPIGMAAVVGARHLLA